MSDYHAVTGMRSAATLRGAGRGAMKGGSGARSKRVSATHSTQRETHIGQRRRLRRVARRRVQRRAAGGQQVQRPRASLPHWATATPRRSTSGMAMRLWTVLRRESTPVGRPCSCTISCGAAPPVISTVAAAPAGSTEAEKDPSCPLQLASPLDALHACSAALWSVAHSTRRSASRGGARAS